MTTIGDLEWLAGPMPLSAVAIGERSVAELRQFADKYDFYHPYLFEVTNGRIVAINLCNYALNIGGKFINDLRGISKFLNSFSPEVIRILSDQELGKLNPKISQEAMDQIAEMFPTATIAYLSDMERSTIEARILKLRQTGKGRWLDGK